MIGNIWASVRDFISSRFMITRSRRRFLQRRDARFLPLHAEYLEQRRLLSANQIALDSITSAIVIQGSSINDLAIVSIDAANMYRVQLTTSDGWFTAAFSRTAVSSIRFLGGDGDDKFTNHTELSSQAWGEGGNDILIGNSGSDMLNGGAGSDTLYGGNNDDVLFGGLDNDYLVGGTGNDWISGWEGMDELFGEGGNDLLYGDVGADSLDGGMGNDYLVGGDGNDWLSGGGDGDDQLFGEGGNDLLYGGVGGDLLNGGMGNDYLVGGDGNDWLTGGEDGIDELYGEAGDDWLYGGIGNDSLNGGLDDDYLVGGDGNDWLSGGEDGIDELYGEAGDDWLYGGSDDDFLNGGVDDDYLIGGDGNDWLSGGDDGDDQLYGEDGNDSLYGGNGNDKLVGAVGNDHLVGGLGDDHLVGDDGNDRLYGEAGNDNLYGGSGDDSLIGGLNQDYLVGGDDNDWLNGEAGNDQLYGQAGDDSLYGGDGNDKLLGGQSDDYIVGGTGNDQLNGEDGDDELHGEAGDDELNGGVGSDLLFGAVGIDYLIGGVGNDWINGGDDADELFGEAGDDFLYGAAGNDKFYGGLGNDRLVGGTGDDYLAGDDGNDTIYGEVGVDSLYGGQGDDLLSGGSFDDYLVAGYGNDVLMGDEGDDELYGEDGNDSLYGGNGDDRLEAGSGNDYLSGGGGIDWVAGDGGDDEMHGDVGNDTLSGSTGNDLLDGGVGDDLLFASDGNDILIGGLGKDELQGEKDEDILIGGSTNHDLDTVKLRALMAVWAAGTPHSNRIEQIEDELFASRLQSEDTVFDDQVADTLYGAAGQDWFFETGYLATYRPVDVNSHDEHDHPAATGHVHTQIIAEDLPELEGFAFIDSLDKLSDRQADEAVHSLVPHADNPVLQREHLSLFQLVRYDQVTDIAVNSGDWTNPTTWRNGHVPTDGARVLIPIGVEVSVNDLIAARIATIRVDGTLNFDTTHNTELRVDTVVVSGSGIFEMGSAAQPIANGVRARLLITDSGAIDRSWDPFGISRGLISHGTVSIHGMNVSSYAPLFSSAVAGTNALLLKSIPTGWKVGDTIVVASSTAGVDQNEVRQIVSVLGKVVLFDRPLNYSHVPAGANLEVHIANVTRNAVIESENTAIDRRGHVMFMHSRDVNIASAGFYQLGRTNKLVPINDSVVNSDWTLKAETGTNPRGRYAVHFHRNGLSYDENPAVISGSAVVDSPGWGFVNHSSNVDMIDNVAYDVTGAAFATEVGDEIGGFYRNLAIGSIGSKEAINGREPNQDFGHQGDGFWFQGAGVNVVGNFSAGHQGHAFVFYNRGLYESAQQARFLSANLSNPAIANGAETIPIGQVPMENFSDNVGYASTKGLTVRYHLENAIHSQYSLFANSQFWNNVHGVQLHYAQNTELRNITVLHAAGVRPSVGIESNLITGNILYTNLTVAGYERGIELPRWGNNVVNGGSYNNVQDLVIPNAVWRDRNVLITGNVGTPKIILLNDLRPPFFPTSSAEVFFVRDIVLLNFGPFTNQRAYYANQQATAIPFPSPRDDVPPSYVGLTNQQLWDQFRKAVGGEVAPSNLVSVQFIVGGFVAST